MGGRRRRRASAVFSRDWLVAAQASPTVQRATCDEVRARLDDLPDVLRMGAGAADVALGWLPAPVLRKASRLPAVSEFARIVESLTAVSYFAMAEVTLPVQRFAPEVPVESRA
ncbi:MAG: hypothetical protein IPG68_03615 [Micrococcales bacterium]|nr:hypothetical protein [Micrococcales bacterium]